MEKEENKKLDNIEKLVEVIATNVLKLTEDMKEVKKEIQTVKVELKKDIHDLSTEFKGFKKDTDGSVEKIKEDIVDLNKTDLFYDKRIEKLEKKIFPELNTV